METPKTEAAPEVTGIILNSKVISVEARALDKALNEAFVGRFGETPLPAHAVALVLAAETTKVRALAWLKGCGVPLDVVREFLKQGFEIQLEPAMDVTNGGGHVGHA